MADSVVSAGKKTQQIQKVRVISCSVGP